MATSPDLNLVFLLMAFGVSVIVIYTVIFILRKAYFTLSPKETAYFATLMFILGFEASAYLAGSSELEFAAFIVVLLLVGWWIIRGLYRRSLARKTGAEESE